MTSAEREFGVRLANVTPDQWDLLTNCGEWTVRDLANHVIGANRMSTVLLAGGDRAAGIAQLAQSDDDADPVQAFADSSAAQARAFAAPGAMAATVAHPVGDIPAGQLFEFRLIDLTVHGWDLAISTQQDPTLDPALVEVLWERLAPRASHLSSTGVFGAGASGTVPQDAPLQARLLDILGRS